MLFGEEVNMRVNYRWHLELNLLILSVGYMVVMFVVSERRGGVELIVRIVCSKFIRERVQTKKGLPPQPLRNQRRGRGVRSAIRRSREFTRNRSAWRLNWPWIGFDAQKGCNNVFYAIVSARHSEPSTQILATI